MWSDRYRIMQIEKERKEKYFRENPPIYLPPPRPRARNTSNYGCNNPYDCWTFIPPGCHTPGITGDFMNPCDRRPGGGGAPFG